MPIKRALREHWPEYLIEGWALGCLMIAIGIFGSALGSPMSSIYGAIPSPLLRALALAIAIGATLAALIHSPWGQRSGAHMNPAITLAFLRIGKVQPWDAAFFIVAQTLGGILGVVVVAALLGSVFTDPPVSYAVTVPGAPGVAVAFVAETAISFILMVTILVVTASPRLIRFTGLAVGAVVAVLILVEAPLSGTSMNPGRTLASAVPGMMWGDLWVYLLGPTLGMLAAAQLHLFIRGRGAPGCTKLMQSRDVRCIHCGYDPAKTGGDTGSSCSLSELLPCMNAAVSPFHR
jgi:aquaporin Z